MKGYTFCCGGIYFYLGGGAFLWRVYGYYYEGMYLCVRDILFAVEGYAFTWGGVHFYGGCMVIIIKGCIFVLGIYFYLRGARCGSAIYYGIIILGLHWGHAWQSQ